MTTKVVTDLLDVSADVKTLLDSADLSGIQTELDLGALASLDTVSNDNFSGTDLALVNGGTGASDASGARTNLGLGSLATLSSVNNGNWSGTALSLANGGTGATSASAARTALVVPDVEKGTWTPTVTLATPGTFSVTYSSQIGRFIRIGDSIWIHCQLVFTPTIGTGTGALRISLPPFLPEVTGSHSMPLGFTSSQFTWPASTTMAVFQTTANQLYGTVRGMGSAVNGVAWTNSQLTNAAAHTLHFTGTYER